VVPTLPPNQVREKLNEDDPMRSAMLAACLMTAAFAVSTDAIAADAPVIGRQIADFKLRDHWGKEHQLSQLGDRKAVVVVFLGTECPLARLYAPRLAELAKEYEPRGVAFLGVDSNQQDSIQELATFARVNALSFPLLKDVGNEVADQFGALRTPEVFVLDGQRTVRYWGRIDDQYGFQTGVGFQRPEPSRRDLAVAIDELLAGEPVSQPVTTAMGCHIGRIRLAKADSSVTYSNQIARILQNRCVECHRPGEVAPFALQQYDDVVGWGEMIREVVHEGRMPPWSASAESGPFVNDPQLTDEEKQLIDQWVENGCPQGSISDLPEPRQFIDGWNIPQPDQVVHMSAKPFNVPAEGVVEYQYFEADPRWTEDKWVKSAEARPGNRSVVHHIIVFIKPPGGRSRVALGPQGFGPTDLLAGFAPGSLPLHAYSGMARHVPAGSKLVFQMHYTPNGQAQQDRSYLGLIFADEKDVTHDVRSGFAANLAFKIPAGASNHQVTSSRKFRRDTLLLSMMPHMHLRGKSFHYEAIYPDGRRETLLDVPRYDFNWQLSYVFPEPKLLPKGTELHCTAHFDNSAANLANPDPTKTVTWGDQTWEEMMIGWFISADAEPIQSVADEKTAAR